MVEISSAEQPDEGARVTGLYAGDQPEVYDPLDYNNVARSIVRELMDRPVYSLPLTKSFSGPGVYLLYYDGDFPPYARLRSPNADRPIYVGKAEPVSKVSTAKSRGKDSSSEPVVVPGVELYSRIVQHATSISAVENLGIAHFRCRYLPVAPLWIRLVENLLMDEYWPLWNKVIKGFGNHDPGGNRSPTVSWWDAMHPGRPAALGWTARVTYVRSQADAEALLAKFLRSPSAVAAEVEAEPDDVEADVDGD